MGAFGITELFIVSLIVFLLFGAKRLPEIWQGLADALSNFRGPRPPQPPCLPSGEGVETHVLVRGEPSDERPRR